MLMFGMKIIFPEKQIYILAVYVSLFTRNTY